MSTSETGAPDQTKTGEVVDDKAKELEGLKAEVLKLVSERDNFKSRLREAESVAQSAKQIQASLDEALAEKARIANEFTGFKETITKKEVDRHLTTALEAAGAKSISTVKKLLDTSKIEFEDGQIKEDTVAAAINALKETDPVLFGEVSDDQKKDQSGTTTDKLPAPSIKVPAAGVNTHSAYETEMKAAKTQQDVEKIMRKYNVLK